MRREPDRPPGIPLGGYLVTVPNTKGWFSTYLGYPSEASNLRGVVFGTLNTFIVKAITPLISHGTDTIVTPYDTGGIEIIPDHSVYAKHRIFHISGPCPCSERLN
jgi:hypothetical protein